MFKKILLGLGVLLALFAAVASWYFIADRGDKYTFPAVDESQIPQFSEAKIDFKNNYDKKKSLPLMAAAATDLDGDGVEELFFGGGLGQADGWFKFENGGFADVTQKLGWQKNLDNTTLGISCIDLDRDSLTDVLVTREEGVLFYKNTGKGFVAPQKLDLPFDEKSQPVAVAVADLNNDGWADFFVSAYLKKDHMEGQTIFNKEGYGGNSKLFLNKGNNTFRDITAEAGLTYTHNTFCAVFVDLNNDNLPDLVVAHDTGEPRIYQNKGGMKFEKVVHPLTNIFSYPMGIAVGDYNNDGLQDLFFSNVGSTMPAMILRGDLRSSQTLYTDMIFLENKGNFKFEDVGKKTKTAKYEFSWGALFEDFNLDGAQDLVIAENYVDLPNSKIFPLPCRFLMQLPDQTFMNIEGKTRTQNPNNAIAPLAGDFNNDGFPDLVFSNLDGTPKAFISKANVANNYLKIVLPNRPEFLNARVTATLSDGKTVVLQRVVAEGLASDQSSTLFLGLGKNAGIPKVVLEQINGTKREILVEKINSTIKI